MGKHGKTPRLWPAVLGVISAGLAVGSLIVLLIVNPGGKPAAAPCQYLGNKVTVVVTGDNCYAIMQHVTSDSDIAWGLVNHVNGKEFARLTNGKDTVKIYEAGNAELAGELASYFQRIRWRPELPEGMHGTPGP